MKWGGPDDLELGELPRPVQASGQVLIDVEAWAVNFADLVLIEGRYQARPNFPFAPGMEVAGRVCAIGDGVETFAVGDRVAAYVEYGGYAEVVAAPASSVVRLPDEIPMVTGAAFPVPYATAKLAADRALLCDGETIVVGGAAGAVGLACIEISKRRGARVIACVSSAEKEQAARAAGADAIVLLRPTQLRDDLRRCAPEGVDVVFDPVGGPFFEAAFQSLAYGGRIVTLGFASGTLPVAPVNQILVRHISVIGSSFGLTCHLNPELVAQNWPPLVALLGAGKIRPQVARTLPFEALPAALQLLHDRAVAGRIVLT